MSVTTSSTGNINAVIHTHSARITLIKKGGNQHKIPYSMGFSYQHPPVDNVPPAFRVDLPEKINVESQEIETLEEAIEVYMQAFRQKFQSREGRKQRRICLQYFQRYLVAKEHSMRLADLTIRDGQGFIDGLVNHYDGHPLRPSQIKKYRSAIRSFSRFLYEVGIIKENVFLTVKKS